MVLELVLESDEQDMSKYLLSKPLDSRKTIKLKNQNCWVFYKQQTVLVKLLKKKSKITILFRSKNPKNSNIVLVDSISPILRIGQILIKISFEEVEFFCTNETRTMLNVTLLLRLRLCPKTSDRNRHKLCGTYTGCPTWTQVKGCLISERSSSRSFLQANVPNHFYFMKVENLRI